MLDSDTKKRINNCRDILVGKVPDPKTQVDQITFAMLYKFMSDMDAKSEALGGTAKYFHGDYAQYSWENLISSNIASSMMLGLYETAIREMPKNQNIEPLFRDIFSNAYLPYRDEETLRIFLKEINGFTYDHSERLGDAFEYLLSILGSQGDAGQFRTARHVIDFMVDIIDPQKDESILDPACGTAGFLISAYNYILNKHHANGEIAPNEVKALQDNIKGYDISPDMVRLSRANMYLHNIQEPHIDLYDTLTSDSKWGNSADIILANPPFMSPKGGIRPHNHFSVQSNRSEVLFVDYIAEHLTSKGRAAVVVPEGIIFRIGKAYKQLRKRLVEKYLVAVISLPKGAFNPYSGVKTSILIFDKALVKKTDKILFAKIENDGYHLGAKRYPIKKNDMPIVNKYVKEWLSCTRNGKEIDIGGIHQLNEISRNKIKNSDDCNLRIENYIQLSLIESKFPFINLGEVADIKKGQSITKKEIIDGSIPVIAGGRDPAYYHNQYNSTGEVITVSASGQAGFLNFFDCPIFASDCSTIKPNKENKINIVYLYNFLKSIQDDIYKLQRGATLPHVYPKDLAKIKIPLPPIEIQKEIVAEIESYQKIIESKKEEIRILEVKINGTMERVWTTAK